MTTTSLLLTCVTVVAGWKAWLEWKVFIIVVSVLHLRLLRVPVRFFCNHHDLCLVIFVLWFFWKIIDSKDLYRSGVIRDYLPFGREDNLHKSVDEKGL